MFDKIENYFPITIDKLDGKLQKKIYKNLCKKRFEAEDRLNNIDSPYPIHRGKMRDLILKYESLIGAFAMDAITEETVNALNEIYSKGAK